MCAVGAVRESVGWEVFEGMGLLSRVDEEERGTGSKVKGSVRVRSLLEEVEGAVWVVELDGVPSMLEREGVKVWLAVSEGEDSVGAGSKEKGAVRDCSLAVVFCGRLGCRDDGELATSVLG